MGNCLPKKEDLDTSVVKDFADPAVPEPSVGDEPEKIIEEEPQPEPEPEPEPIVEPAPEETIVEEKPKSFMDKVDAFRDSCCGVSASATGVDKVKEDSILVSGKDEPEDDEEAEEEASAVTEKAESVLVSEEQEPPTTESVVEKPSDEVTEPVVATDTAPVIQPKFRSPTFKERRKLKKKLREIEAIEEKKATGEELTNDQLEKLASKDDVLEHLNTL